MKEFSDILEENFGCIPNYNVTLKLQDNAEPVYTKERQISYALTDWSSPLVVVPKSGGGVSLCVDYKVVVNQRLLNVHYPLRRIENFFNNLRNAKHFCRLDLYKAYLHLAFDEPSSII